MLMVIGIANLGTMSMLIGVRKVLGYMLARSRMKDVRLMDT
jgi:hypothetical protein